MAAKKEAEAVEVLTPAKAKAEKIRKIEERRDKAEADVKRLDAEIAAARVEPLEEA